MAFCIGNEAFKTKKAATDRIRGILHSCELNVNLSGGDFEFIRDLINNHPSAHIKIGSGIKNIRVKTNPVFKQNRGFWIERTDGTETDFSFVECLSPKDKSKKFRTACRNAVRDDILFFRNMNLTDQTFCPFTGEKLSIGNAHVDHIPPKTFDWIVTEFIKSNAVDINSIELTGKDDGEIGQSFIDPVIASRFRDFHGDRAELRLVSVTANLSDVKIQSRFA